MYNNFGEFMDNNIKKQIVSGTYDAEVVKEFGITHIKYADCDENMLVKVDNKLLHKDCAEAFIKMQKAAKKEGIKLFVVSGFRSKLQQISIFKKKFKDKENPTDEEMYARLQFSAPAGYSEHHTGYAVDINSLEQDFEEEDAYKWLLTNAPHFGFENSFPKNNVQNLGFEPWHWRYVGDENTRKIFQYARNLKK